MTAAALLRAVAEREDQPTTAVDDITITVHISELVPPSRWEGPLADTGAGGLLPLVLASVFIATGVLLVVQGRPRRGAGR
ncbi:hypothetical protein ACFWN7_13370 [Agromyces sp. NPDC058484]|uniref:hypothetical protein n=1 Tax=Agromyces sp. NPDC058484 TaxID=3346524 RepID=UPI003661F2EA